jgi:hypothetical protein
MCNMCLKPQSHIPVQDPVIRGRKLKLITTTIRYCSGSVPIQPLPAKFVPILQFSIRFWSDLYLSHGKKLPNLSRQRPDSPECDPTEIRQWVTLQWTARSGLNRQWKISQYHARSSRQRPDPQDTVQTTQDIVTMLIRYSRICHDIVTIVIRLEKIGWLQSLLSFPNVTGRT